ncbi:MAG: glycosyltransferase [Clostridia bacterium]|nr:glycosyltransferase [Clostridia bacterium]
MNIIEINSVDYGSTGKIALQIAETVENSADNVYVCTSGGRKHKASKSNPKRIYIGGFFSEKLHLVLDRLTGYNGCFSCISTAVFLNRIKKLKPDIIHLHNLHNCYINLPMLFKFIKKHNIRVVWTLHDGWAFTGHCACFDMVGCQKWKSGCFKCPSYKQYPKSLVDRSQKMYQLKKKWFTEVKDLTIVTPSQWLADLAKQSFLKDYPVKVINNGIDLSVFKPTVSDFKEKNNCEDKIILLGVAFGWGERKGLDAFLTLAERLDDKYQIVLVGTDEGIDERLPANIISIHRTQNQIQLAELYTAANLFINPTRDDNFPTVNMEALACGTPVLTFRTGGSPEMLDDTCGAVVEKDDIDALYAKVLDITQNKRFSKEACIERAKKYDNGVKFKEYADLYKRESLI